MDGSFDVITYFGFILRRPRVANFFEIINIDQFC